MIKLWRMSAFTVFMNCHCGFSALGFRRDRTHQAVSFQAANITQNMLVGEAGNGLPERLHGIWWMDGNPFWEEVMSFGGSLWDHEAHTIAVNYIDEGVWTWNDSFLGRSTYKLANLLQFRLTFRFDENLSSADISVSYQLFRLSLNAPRKLLSFTMQYTEEGYWLRDTTIFLGIDLGGYDLRQIVDGYGELTDVFDTFLKSTPETLLVSRRL